MSSSRPGDYYANSRSRRSPSRADYHSGNLFPEQGGRISLPSLSSAFPISRFPGLSLSTERLQHVSLSLSPAATDYSLYPSQPRSLSPERPNYDSAIYNQYSESESVNFITSITCADDFFRYVERKLFISPPTRIEAPFARLTSGVHNSFVGNSVF
jgi:hypothetical protein